MKSPALKLLVVCCVAIGVVESISAVALFGWMMFPEPGMTPCAPWAVVDQNCPPMVMIDPPMQFPQVAPAQPCTKEDLAAQRGAVVPVRDCTFSGPFTHANLTLFLIHGPDTLKEQRVLSLQTALDQGLAVVHEGLLTVDNRADVPVFIQAGDIVKGGIQDRVVPYDQLVPPGMNQGPMFVFCVEAGRSGPRGRELSTSFTHATEQLPGKRLNLAARQQMSQPAVWEGVRQVQMALAQNVGQPVQAAQSQTSLQLTLEHGAVHQGVQNYLDELAPLPAGRKDVIGVAVVINGQIQSADVYASSDLFRDLWPKVLKANAVAALAEQQQGAAKATLSAEAVQQFLAEAESGQVCQQQRYNSTLVLRQESGRALLFDACDPARQNLVVHRSFLAK